MIALENVSKVFRAPLGLPLRPPVRALDQVDVQIQPGSAIGVVGLNGAGKSTLVRLLLGYAAPTTGTVRIAGLSPRAYVEKNGVAYVPERVAIPGGWRVREALRAYAMLGGLGEDAWDRVERALSRMGLEPLASRRISALSKGNVQRVGIAQALLGDRSLLVLDEPTDGLDPVWIAELRAIIAEWRAADSGRVLVLASHNLTEVARLCDRVIVLHEGRVRAWLELEGQDGTELEARFLELLHAPRPAA